jgi:pimeloyl-ACP methyl ester carboxylesterase
VTVVSTHWDVRESGPPQAEHTVLCLPGGLCTAMQYEELMAEPKLADVHLVAATLPGHGGTPEPEDVSIENYAALAAELAAEHDCDAIVGFSLGANVALEMAGSGAFSGPLVLLAPSFSAEDEAAFLRGLDKAARVLGHLPFAAMLKGVHLAVKESPLPAERRDQLVAVLRQNDPHFMRRAFHEYLGYLNRYGSVAGRLCEAGVWASVVHGEHGDGGVTDDERRTLEACGRIHLITLPGTSYFMPNEEPALVADLLLQGLELSPQSAPAPGPEQGA